MNNIASKSGNNHTTLLSSPSHFFFIAMISTMRNTRYNATHIIWFSFSLQTLSWMICIHLIITVCAIPTTRNLNEEEDTFNRKPLNPSISIYSNRYGPLLRKQQVLPNDLQSHIIDNNFTTIYYVQSDTLLFASIEPTSDPYSDDTKSFHLSIALIIGITIASVILIIFVIGIIIIWLQKKKRGYSMSAYESFGEWRRARSFLTMDF